MDSLLQQLKKRRLQLGLKQSDMELRIGFSRQQYQRLESKGNPRLETLELVAKGLQSEILLIPKEKLAAVLNVLNDQTIEGGKTATSDHLNTNKLGEAASRSGSQLSDDPWQDLMEDQS